MLRIVGKKFLRVVLIACVSAGAVSAYFHDSPSATAASDTFHARATLNLCADYKFGGVTLELKYRVGAQSTYTPITVTSQTIDNAANTGTFDFSLPSTFQATPIAVAAFCRNGLGLGIASNEKLITNCDALALKDTDFDGITDNLEDTNCDNFFSPGDASNLENVDTDGDGVRDLVERVSGSDATNPGSSPRPYIYSSAPFDPDGNGASNPVVWRPSNGNWYIKDFISDGNNLSFNWGFPGDIPFAYQPNGLQTTDVGVIRRTGNSYLWLFHGPGFKKSDSTSVTALEFGIFGDNILVGPWEEPGMTSPAVARLFNNIWFFDIYLRDGSIRHAAWGGNGDVPTVQDFDGDGLFDIAVYRPSLGKTYVINSSDGTIDVYTFGTGTAEFTVRGDYTGDGIDDISFWESTTGMFSTLTSTNGFNDVQGASKNPSFYQESSLGLYFVHLPLNWTKRGGRILYTVVDHASGQRFFRAENNPSNPITVESWGLAGDAMG